MVTSRNDRMQGQFLATEPCDMGISSIPHTSYNMGTPSSATAMSHLEAVCFSSFGGPNLNSIKPRIGKSNSNVFIDSISTQLLQRDHLLMGESHG